MTAPLDRQTALYRLVDAKLRGQSLAHYLAAARAALKPFRLIASDLAAKTGEDITPETVRRWVRDLEEKDDRAPSALPGHEKRVA